MDNQKIAEAWAVFIIAIVVFSIYMFGVGPLGLWLIFNPIGITVNYMGRVSMSAGILLIKTSLTSSGSSK